MNFNDYLNGPLYGPDGLLPTADNTTPQVTTTGTATPGANGTASTSSLSDSWNSFTNWLNNLGNGVQGVTDAIAPTVGDVALPIAAFNSQQDSVDTLNTGLDRANATRQGAQDTFNNTLNNPASTYLNGNPALTGMANDFASGPNGMTLNPATGQYELTNPIQTPQGLTDVANSLTPDKFNEILTGITEPGIMRGRQRMAQYGLENSNTPFEQLYVSHTGATLYPQLQQNVIGASQAIAAIDNYNRLDANQKVQLHNNLGQMLSGELSKLHGQDLVAATSVLNQALNSQSSLYQSLSQMDSPAMAAALMFLMGQKMTAPTGGGNQTVNVNTGGTTPGGTPPGTPTDQGGGGVQTWLDNLGGLGKDALAGVGMYVSMIPGMDKVVQSFADGSYRDAAGNLVDKAGNSIKDLLGMNGVDPAWETTATGLVDMMNYPHVFTWPESQAVINAMQQGASSMDAINGVLSGSSANTADAFLANGGGITNPLPAPVGSLDTEAANLANGTTTPGGPPAASPLATGGAGVVGGTLGTMTASQFTKHWKLSDSGQLTRKATTGSGAAAGTSIGAAIGSAVGPIGTVVGAGIGAFVGAIAGWFGGSAIGRGLFGDGDKHGLSNRARRGAEVLHKYAKDIPADEAGFQSWLKDQSGGAYDTGKHLEDSNNAMMDTVAISTLSMIEDPTKRTKAAEDYFIGAAGSNGKFNNSQDAVKFAMLTDDNFYNTVMSNVDVTRSGNNDRNVLTGGIYQGDKPGTVVYDKFKELSDRYGIRSSDTGDFAHDLGVFVKQLDTMGVTASSVATPTQPATPAAPPATSSPPPLTWDQINNGYVPANHSPAGIPLYGQR